MWAVSWAASKRRPPSTTGTVSPILRLNSRTTRSGSVTARRTAASPTSMTPSSRRNSTEGTVGARSPSATVAARPSRQVAAALKVVPTSMPTA